MLKSVPGGISVFQAIGFGGQHEVALGQAVDLVGPNGQLHVAPREEDVG